MRDEVLSSELFNTLLEAQVLIGDWKHEYKQLQAPQQSWLALQVAYAMAREAEN